MDKLFESSYFQQYDMLAGRYGSLRAPVRRIRTVLAIALALAVMSQAALVYAQPTSGGGGLSYPAKSVRLVIPVGAGAQDDFHGRILAQGLTRLMGQQFVVDNRPGAGGMIGQDFVVKSPADGYTLLMGGGSMTGAKYVKANLPFDVMRDFAPVSLVAVLQSCLVVHPSVPAKNVKEFIALAHARPGALNFASGGIGQTGYFSAAYFNAMAKTNTMHVPYKSVSGMYSDIFSGQIDSSFIPVGSVLTYGQGGKLRALGVSGAKRSLALPDIPTIAEAAIPGYEMTTWYSILVPAGTPRSIIDALNLAIARVVTESRERMVKAGVEPGASTPEELLKRMADGVEKYGRTKLAGLKPE
jgi:tripartite-type tricarboxylate transporter receptor subunit TctC